MRKGKSKTGKGITRENWTKKKRLGDGKETVREYGGSGWSRRRRMALLTSRREIRIKGDEKVIKKICYRKGGNGKERGY